jgi:hypothetical protein
MMRIPLPALFAALVVVAAGSVLLTTHFSTDEPYVINATGLNHGQNVTVTLDFIPSRIFVLSNDAGAFYSVFVYADATFKTPWDWWPFLTEGLVVIDVPANGTAVVKVVEARDTKAKIVVIRW